MSANNAHEAISNLLMGISLIWVGSKLLSILFDKWRLPNVLGELCAGLLFSVVLLFLPHNFWLWKQLDFIRSSELIFILGELGIILLLFEVGLETELDKIAAVGKEASLVALGGVVAPFGFTFLLNYLFHFAWSFQLTLFIGLVLAATSIGVTARVFQDLKVLHTKNAQVVLGAAVLDDILGLILLSVIVAFVQLGAQSVSVMAICTIVLKAALFLGAAIWLGEKIGGKLIPWLGNLGFSSPQGFMIWVLAFCFISAYFAGLLGLAPIIGAFAAGVTLDRLKIDDSLGPEKKVEDFIAPVRAILAPIFFVRVGLSIDPMTAFSMLSLLLIVVACLSKLLSSWLFLPFKVDFNRLIVGVGMLPRGEVGLVVAAIGSQIGLLNNELYSALLVAVVATTFIAPLWLQSLIKTKEGVRISLLS
jgi:Kef-type K+ transport system membrane component KefB